MSLMSVELNETQFQKVTEIVHRHAGIRLRKGKEALVKARLAKRLRAIGLSTINDYMAYLESDAGAEELDLMIDAMTTNKTNFFRESAHFDFLREEVLPKGLGQRMRFWSAACSSGEEPYSLAILLREAIPDIDRRDILILATDISMRMLDKARNAEYPQNTLATIPADLRYKYFERVANGGEAWRWRVKPNVRNLVRLGWLNLMESWPMKGPFDVIFCRNVMIYFDRLTHQTLVNRFWDLLKPGGYLFVGHSEGLTSISHSFRYIRPATYRK